MPIIETQAENISSYIPTNLISITDGQIYLSPTLFSMGVLPAVDVSKSVSRVGGKAQLPDYRRVAGGFKLDYAQFEELESFARFGAKLDQETVKVIEHGRRIRRCMKQKETDPVAMLAQFLILFALTNKLFDDIPLSRVEEGVRSLIKASKEIPQEISKRFYNQEKLSEEHLQALNNIAKEILERFYPKSKLPEKTEKNG